MPLATCETTFDSGVETVVSRRSGKPFKLGLAEASRYLGVPPEELEINHRGVPGIEVIKTGRVSTCYFNDQALAYLGDYFTNHPKRDETGTRQFRMDTSTGTAIMEYVNGKVTRQMILRLQ